MLTRRHLLTALLASPLLAWIGVPRSPVVVQHRYWYKVAPLPSQMILFGGTLQQTTPRRLGVLTDIGDP